MSTRAFLMVQVVVAAIVGYSFLTLSDWSWMQLHALATGEKPTPTATLPRNRPLEVGPLHNDPEVVSEEELAAVLERVLPRFAEHDIRPNHVEHAVRLWGLEATFEEPGVMSGTQMRDVLLDHGRFLSSWGDRAKPLLIERPAGIAVRWGNDHTGSVHHDHLLASLTEAGVTLDQPVFAPHRETRVRQVLQEALRDFELDAAETEWSAMAFTLWLPPTREFTTFEGRIITFDLLAERLMRGHQRFGTCAGTHRVYSLVLMLRVDEEFDLLSEEMRRRVWEFVETVRDRLIASQSDEGYWSSDWMHGERARTKPTDAPEYQRVIATGHHLEWMAIAPRELLIPRERILKAADWLIAYTLAQPDETIRRHYTFYSHVGNALALWRGERPIDFWRTWRKAHPDKAHGPRPVGRTK